MLLKRLINGPKTIPLVFAEHVLYYPTPSNLNYIWSFGSLVGLIFGCQLITGIFLAMYYTANVGLAFASVVHIMDDVNNGYILRYAHANGASMIFILIYAHIAKGLYYNSFAHVRRYLWWSGVVIFILMMATAFIGYVLPWGQMSFWGATVITSLVTAIPYVGTTVAYWIWGGFSITNTTLVRFFSVHYLLPFIITGIILLHLTLLHKVGSTNPHQLKSAEKITFHPYFTYKDTFCFVIVLVVFFTLIFFQPNLLGHPDNFIKANALVTPPHIVPEWYFTPFYAILRAFPSKLGGVIAMGGSLLILLALPLYPQSARLAPTTMSLFFNINWWIFVCVFFMLLYLGSQAAAQPFIIASQIFTALYFFYFIVVIPQRETIENFIRQDFLSL